MPSDGQGSGERHAAPSYTAHQLQGLELAVGICPFAQLSKHAGSRCGPFLFGTRHFFPRILAYVSMMPRLHKFTLTAHVTVSVGWLGAVLAYLAPAVAGLATEDAQMLRAAYFAMDLIARFVIVPLSLAALTTGLVQSLGTEWGLFRYYWIVVKFVLTVAAVFVLLLHLPTVSRVAEMTLLSANPGMLRVQVLVHALGGLFVLLIATVLSIYKPWGRIRYRSAQPC
jgi:hypothetical protein